MSYWGIKMNINTLVKFILNTPLSLVCPNQFNHAKQRVWVGLASTPFLSIQFEIIIPWKVDSQGLASPVTRSLFVHGTVKLP